ncbi:hypothetical protein BV25DRAFT_1843250 [Artomyces pyxidatus]|uniref:Uncharacterized protein n=1 Tax=Artomyces pyxidatus TaxID=48021 RepID=A0ACB8SF87_9AGAM|nr:hypothetical protein BV25DRAFT_1843250 [Artomyces pyxidatus]
MPPTSKKNQVPAAGAAGGALTPAQKAAATRKANREKKEAAAAAAADSPEAVQEPGSARATRPRRGAASTVARAGQEAEVGTRKRAASSAEPRGTEGSAKKAPKQHKSGDYDLRRATTPKSPRLTCTHPDVALASHNVPMEVDEPGGEEDDGAKDAYVPAGEQLQLSRPRPSTVRQSGTRVHGVARDAAPAQAKTPHASAETEAGAQVEEEEAEEDADAEDVVVEEARASDEAEHDEQWAGTEDQQDEDAPSKKTTKALARQFEEATPTWVRKGKGPAPVASRTELLPPQGRNQDTQGNPSGARSDRAARHREIPPPISNLDNDQDLERSYRDDEHRSAQLDPSLQDGPPATQQGRRGAATSLRRGRVDSIGEDAPAKGDGALLHDVDDARRRERAYQSTRHQGNPGSYRERGRDVDRPTRSQARRGDDQSPHSQKDRARQQRGLDSYGGSRGFYEGDREGSKHLRSDQGFDRGRDDRHRDHDRRGSDRREHRARSPERDHDRVEHAQPSIKPRGATRRQHGHGQRWNDGEAILEIDASGDERPRHMYSNRRGGAHAYQSESDEEDDNNRPHRRQQDHVHVKQERGQGGGGTRVRRRTRATFVIDSNDELEDGEDAESEDSQEEDDLPRDGQWPGRTKFNMGEKGRPTLAGQFTRVANVISYICATEVLKFVCFQDAFPLADDRVPLYRTALMKGARATKSRTIHARLESDSAYVEKMAIIPEGRVSIFRGKVRDKAAAGVKMHYRFSSFPAHDFTNIIGKLLEDRRHIFPGDAVKKTIEDGRPYCHSSLIYIIHESFFGGNPVKKFPVEYYPLSPRTKKRQLPKSMVALAATANEAALMAYRMGPTAVKIAFYGDTFDNVYSVHIATLDSILEDDEEIYDGLMTYLYEQVAGEGSTAGPSSSSRRGDQVRPISIITANMAKRFK